MLFYTDLKAANRPSAVPVRISFKSILFGYLRVYLGLWGFCGTLTFIGLTHHESMRMPQLFGLAAVMSVAPCLVLLVLRRLSRASFNRRQRLSQVAGLPSEIVARLRQKDQDTVWLEELAPQIGGDER